MIRSTSFLASALVALLLSAAPVHAATYYIGAFTGSTPADDSDCGTGMGAHPSGHPCATLAYWHQSRNLGSPGDTIRIAPGVYTSTSAYHCLEAEKSGVTYRGSTAAGQDTSNRNLVTIVGPSSGNSPCRGAVVKFISGTSTNISIRDLTVNGCPNADNGHCLQFSPQPGQGSLSGLTIANVRVTNGPTTGVWIGAYDGSPGPDGEMSEPFNMSNVTVVDSEFDGNCFHTVANGAGLQIAAVNGGTVARNKIHDNLRCLNAPTGTGTSATCTRESFPTSCDNGECNCDGLHMAGRNFTVADNEIYRNEEDGIDVGANGASNDCPKTTARFHTFERNKIHDNGLHNFSMNGCAHDLVVRNNMIWGYGAGINQYECAGYSSVFDNNTVRTYAPALFVYATMWPVKFQNNIFVTTSSNTSVWIDAGSTNTSSTWTNNVVQNLGSGFAARADFPTETVYPNCQTGSGTNCCTDPDGPSSVGPIPARGRATSVDFRNGELAKWKADGAAGNLFGAATGAGDVWGTPTFVDSTLSYTGLHLQSSDTVARANGVVLSGFLDDIDGAKRGASVWDIGAHAVSAGALAAPSLLSVVPVP
jgi:hypothetical protein